MSFVREVLKRAVIGQKNGCAAVGDRMALHN